MIDHDVYGIHAVHALLQNKKRKTKQLYINQERDDQRLHDILHLAEQADIPVQRLTARTLDQKFPAFTHQGVVAIASALPEYSQADLPQLLTDMRQPGLILILDGITDPHNLGACLRSADAAGVDLVIIPKDKSAPITPVVSKIACGAAESIPIARVTNLARAMDILKEHGVWLYGAAGESSTSVYEIDFTTSSALVMGAEGNGLRRLTRDLCDGLFALPMLGSVESLNVSVATGICLYEVIRQRRA